MSLLRCQSSASGALAGETVGFAWVGDWPDSICNNHENQKGNLCECQLHVRDSVY